MESMIPRGVSKMTRPNLAFACNERSMAAFTTKAASLGRERLKALNGTGVKAFAGKAEARLKRLEPVRANAQKLLEAVDGRKSSGELDELTAYSESVGPQIVLELSDFLQRVYTKAVDAEDSFALSRVFAMTASLEAASSELLKTQSYATEEPTAFSTLVETSVAMARGVHKNIVDGLFECPSELGLTPPAFPELPKTLMPKPSTN
jgi:hypothetical protein